MKSLIALLLVVVSANASPGLVSTFNYGTAYNHALAYGAPAVAAAPAAVTYAAPGGFGYQTVATAPATVAYTAAAPAVTYAAPATVAYAAPAPVAIPAVTKTQYHAQDVLGQASFGYSYPGQAHHTVRDAAGNERGSYAYINPDGNEIRVNYVAGHGGFQAESNALPQNHIAVAPAAVATAPFALPIGAPAVPADTPEVVEARIAHAHAHAQARARNGLLRKKRGIVAPVATYAAPVIPAATSYAYSTTLHQPFHTAYTAAAVNHPTAFSTYSTAAVHHPLTTYAAVSPAAYTIHNNPGHAVSYRVY